MISIYFIETQDELTIEVLTNHLELHIESKRVRASCIRFWGKDGQDTGDDGRMEMIRTTLSSSYSI